MKSLNKSEIINLLPHREPMLLIDELYDIQKWFGVSNFNNTFILDNDIFLSFETEKDLFLPKEDF